MLDASQAAIVKGMLARGDRQHDVAAHFNENFGRIADIATGKKFADVLMASVSELPLPRRRLYIDPNSPVDQQYAQLLEIIAHPPDRSLVLTITPELAELILAKLNTRNRRQRPANIKKFADALTYGYWIITGDTIKFCRSGSLIDGQNRLRACVRSGVAMQTHVVFGIDDDAFDRIDANAVRNNPDTLQIAGVPHAAVAAPAVRWLIILSEQKPGELPSRGRTVANQELRRYYNQQIDQERLNACCRDVRDVHKTLPKGPLAAHLYLFGIRDEAAKDRFVKDLRRVERGGRKLIDKLERLRAQNMGRLNELQITALMTQAFNTYRRDVTLRADALNWDENKPYPSIE